MDFERLIHQWQLTYYSDVFMLVAELIALVLGILYARKDKAGRWFIFYIAFDFFILLTDMYMLTDSSISNKFIRLFQDKSNTLIALAELFVYYYFFSLVLVGKKIKQVLTSLYLFFFIVTIIYITTSFSFITPRFSYIALLIGSLEFLLLLPPCILYFLQLFKNINTILLFKRPSFWIVTGIFLFSVVSIPYYLVYRSFPKISPEMRGILNAVFYYLPFSINFIFLSKAFLCKKTLTI